MDDFVRVYIWYVSNVKRDEALSCPALRHFLFRAFLLFSQERVISQSQIITQV